MYIYTHIHIHITEHIAYIFHTHITYILKSNRLHIAYYISNIINLHVHPVESARGNVVICSQDI